MATKGVVPIDVDLVERLGVQRRVILEQAEILEALGFEDSGVAALAEGPKMTTPPRGQGRWLRLYVRATVAYLALDLVSVKVPGPMSWLEIDEHVLILQYLGNVLRWLA